MMPASSDVEKLAELLPADAWVPEADLHGYAVQDVAPLAAIRPADEAQAVAAMRLAVSDKWAVVPWGAGTAQGRGTPPEQYDLCVSTERMTGIVEHYPEDMVATIRAGTPLADVQQQLAKHGQWWPIDPPDAGATVGGILATNRSGPRRVLYGAARDHVLGMRVLHADGVVTKHGGKVVKNVAGYDLNKLHIGALGTLGIMLEVSVKVRPVPAHETILAAPFAKFDKAAEALAAVASCELQPTAVELLNERAAQAVVPAAVGPAVALVAVEGPPMAIERQVRQVTEILTEAGGGTTTVMDRGDVAGVWNALRDLGAGGHGGAALWCGVAVLPEHVGVIAGDAQRIAEEHSQRLLLDARAANGVFRLGLVGDPQPLLARHVVEAWRALAALYGGTLVVEAAPANVRGDLDVWGPTRQDFPLMRTLKRSLDPDRLLNRGRYVGGL